MLSPGILWKKIPKDLQENASFRYNVLMAAQEDPSIQNSLRSYCAEDILFYVNTFVYTFDPRKTQGLSHRKLPFVTWNVQDKAILEILDCVENGHDLVIEKSRDMGATWMCLIVMEWLWRFKDGMTFLAVTRKQDLVDDSANPDSLFWKIDFIQKNLPIWLQVRSNRKSGHFGNIENGSTIDGEATVGAAGVGGRRTAIFIDEFSRIEEASLLEAGTADTTNCRIYNFTPFGTNNAAYKLSKRRDIRKIRLHWSDHPEKARGLYRWNRDTGIVDQLDRSYNYHDYSFVMDGKTRSPWYDKECKRRANDREVAQMLDIDYQGSSFQFFDSSAILDLQLKYGCQAYWEGDIEYDNDNGHPMGLVRIPGGPLKLWCNLNHKGLPPEAPYAAGADIATGVGATNSCLSIIDCRTGEKVAQYVTPFKRPEQFAAICVALVRTFKNEESEGALFAWEQPGPGVIFGRRVVELGYRRIYYRLDEKSLVPALGKDGKMIPGWFPSNDNKRLLLEEYRAALSQEDFINRAVEALEECKFFIYNSQGNVVHSQEENSADPTGARFNHGDLTIADALAWKMCKRAGSAKEEKKKEESPVGSLAWRRLIHKETEKELEWA